MPSALPTWHPGEDAMHNLMKVPRMMNPTSPGLPPRYGMRVMRSPLLALGTLDNEGRPWTTIWGGERGFARPIAENVLGINSAVDTLYDPVFQSLWDGTPAQDGEVVRPGNGAGKAMAGLAIDLETRDRVKLAGRMLAGAVVDEGRSVQLAMVVEESLGNCPKYLNKKDVVPHDMQPQLVSRGVPLPEGVRGVIERADLFFLSSANGEAMDTNHRGGAPGFVRVVRNDEDGLEIVYPEYSGNRLYQTLGNLKLNPRVGIAIPDFNTGDVLYLTGTASILIGPDASAVIAKTNLAVKISVSDTKFIASGLPFRAAVIDYSPYNPPIRHLLTEHAAIQPADTAYRPSIYAQLTKRERITPSINRFTFTLDGSVPTWRAGQYITLDFEPELGAGYSHMRDDDPQSLNDDYVRTFTISSPPSDRGEIQLTMRRHGPVTNFLWRHNLRVPLEIPVLGFGGADEFHMVAQPAPVFIGAGVGITPLLAQASGLLDKGVPLKVLWTLKREDRAFAVEEFKRIPGLAEVTTLFVTGDDDGEEEGLEGVEVVRRRMGRGDVEGLRGMGRRFYLCTGPGMLKSVVGWLEGESVVWEDFNY